MVVDLVGRLVGPLAAFAVAMKVEKLVYPQVASSDEQVVAKMVSKKVLYSVALMVVWMG